MKLKKKILGVLMSMCLIIALVPSVAYAASGRVYFTDLTTEAGEEFEIRIWVTSESEEIGQIDFDLNYDSDMIYYVSGDDGFTVNGDSLVYSGEGSGVSTEIYVTFLALKEGDTSITFNSQTITSSDGATVIDMVEGSSAITISGGTEVDVSTLPSNEPMPEVVVEEVTYSISSSFTEAEIPTGFSTTTYTYEGESYSGVTGDTSGIELGYLVGSDGLGQFFCYDSDTSTFSPYVQVNVSETAYIVFLMTDIEGSLPDEFVETVLTVNGFEFPTWEDTSSDGCYLIHAINTYGEDSIYRYDSTDQTYQRYYYEAEVIEGTAAVVEEPDSVLDEYMQWIMIGGGAAALIFLVLIIVLAVKLRNRNLELDDLYDEIELSKKVVAPVKKAVEGAKPPVKKKVPSDKKAPAAKKALNEKKAIEENRAPLNERGKEERRVVKKKPPVEKRYLEEDLEKTERMAPKRRPVNKNIPKEEKVEPKPVDLGSNDELYGGFSNDFSDGFDDFDEFDKFAAFNDDFSIEFNDEKADAYERDIKDEYSSEYEDDFEEIVPKRTIKKKKPVSTEPQKRVRKVVSKKTTVNDDDDDIEFLD